MTNHELRKRLLYVNHDIRHTLSVLTMQIAEVGPECLMEGGGGWLPHRLAMYYSHAKEGIVELDLIEGLSRLCNVLKIDIYNWDLVHTRTLKLHGLI